MAQGKHTEDATVPSAEGQLPARPSVDADGRVVLQNPRTGSDTRIRQALYQPVREAILAAIEEAEPIAFSALRAEVERRTPPELWRDASVGWYTTAVKLDLEARGLIHRHGSPQLLSSPAAATP